MVAAGLLVPQAVTVRLEWPVVTMGLSVAQFVTEREEKPVVTIGLFDGEWVGETDLECVPERVRVAHADTVRVAAALVANGLVLSVRVTLTVAENDTNGCEPGSREQRRTKRRIMSG